MAKSDLRLHARELRGQGISVRDIAQQLQVAKSTASLWVRDVILSIDQLEKLRNQHILGGEKGRMIGALRQKQDRLNRIQEGTIEGARRIANITERELLLTGIALYWAEGNKRYKKIEFCNSDPKLVQFMLNWFQRVFNLNTKDFKCYVGINAAHKQREQEVIQYWSKVTGLPLEQFTKTSFKKTPLAKVYENFDSHYGTLAVRVVRSSRIIHQVMGLIEGLKVAQLSG